jgi:hypothetical protein
MKFGSRFVLLALAVAVAALSFGAASASGAATVTVNGANTDAFNADGTGQLTGTMTFGTIACTAVAVDTTDDRGAAGDGLATTQLVFGSCQANLLAGTCVVTAVNADTEVDSNGHYTVDQATTTTIVCDAVVNCTAASTVGTTSGTIDDVNDTADLVGTSTKVDGTTHCIGNVTGDADLLQDITID